MNIKVSLRISHYHGSSTGVHLEIIDELSNAHFVSLDLTHEQLGRALGSMSVDGIPAEVRGLNVVGMMREIEHITVPKKVGLYDKHDIRKYLTKHTKQYEVDGWKVDIDKALRTQQNGDEYHLHKTRYVPVNPGAER